MLVFSFYVLTVLLLSIFTIISILELFIILSIILGIVAILIVQGFQDILDLRTLSFCNHIFLLHYDIVVCIMFDIVLYYYIIFPNMSVPLSLPFYAPPSSPCRFALSKQNFWGPLSDSQLQNFLLFFLMEDLCLVDDLKSAQREAFWSIDTVF